MRFHLFQYPIPTESDLDDLNRFLASNRVVSVTREIVNGSTGAEGSKALLSHAAGWPNAWVSPCVVVIRSYWKVAAEAMTQGSFSDYLAFWIFLMLVMAGCADA